MIDNKIRVRLLDSSVRFKTVKLSIDGIEYVEQLIYDILKSEGVGPLYRHIFGIRLIGKQIWLAPNQPIKQIYAWSKSNLEDEDDVKLELLMRFRPSCYNRLLYQDKNAFELVYAQIRYDFLHTKFNDEKRDLVLLNDAVLVLVALDLIRHAIENDIDVKELLKKVDKDNFLPKRAAKWQRLLLFRIADQINLQKSLPIILERCGGDQCKVKKEYVELFLLGVAQDYGYESYNIRCAPDKLSHIFPGVDQSFKTKSKSKRSSRNSDQFEIRVRYHQERIERSDKCDQVTDQSDESLAEAENSICILELRPKSKNTVLTSNGHNKKELSNSNKQLPWHQICDIESISHATLREDVVQIARHNEAPIRFKFDTQWHAKSFLSCIDGYYRLLKKWNFNLCREVYSPDLEYLKKIRCHGPIGYETTKSKLSHLRSSGTFLIRRCMNLYNRYLIDTVLPAKTKLTIDIDHDEAKRCYKKVGHSCDRSLHIIVKTSQERYPCLKSLVNDIEVRVRYDKNHEEFTQQLKHWLQPEEDDDYPALLLSLSKRRLEHLGQPNIERLNDSTDRLPIIIPSGMLRFFDDRSFKSKNGIKTSLAKFNPYRDVVVKDYNRNYQISEDEDTNRSSFTFHFCPTNHEEAQFAATLKPTQIRMTDWIFINSPFFAETVGFMITSGSLVQEYFPMGSLDKYLAHNTQVPDVTKLSISFQLAQALLYLQEKKIVHGKLRCHNIFVHRACPLQIKLADPLGALDLELDQAFIPPEFFRLAIQMCVKQFYTGIDVWSFGTTLWQVFNQGNRPPSGRYANTLTKPTDCPEDVWQIIESCWRDDPADRPSPQILYRDLFDLFAWEKGAHDYLYISRNVMRDMTLVEPGITAYELTPTSTMTPTSTLADLSSISNTDSSSPIIHQKFSNHCDTRALLPHSLLVSDSDRGGENKVGAATNGLALTSSAGLTDQANGHNLQNHQRRGTSKISSTWRSLMQIRDRASVFVGKKSADGVEFDNSLPPDVNLSRLNGSCSSLSSSCLTSSEATALTNLPDYESLSEALNRCVWHVDSSRLQLGSEIGRGSSGVVRKGVMYDPDGMTEQVVAVKCIDKDRSSFSLHHMNDLRREFEIMKDLNHKNIVKTLGYVEEACMMLIFEYMPLGSLMSCIKNLRHEDLKDLPLQKYAYDIACGMEYLESKKIVHRDLALRNILLKSRNEVKICDFGLAQFLGSNNHYELKTERALPLKWYAPEAICTWIFTHKSDVWSYGVVLWEIYSGGDNPQYPGELKHLTETLKHERLRRPKDCPLEVYELMLKCWAYEPENRISFCQLKEGLSQLVVLAVDQQVTTDVKSSRT